MLGAGEDTPPTRTSCLWTTIAGTPSRDNAGGGRGRATRPVLR